MHFFQVYWFTCIELFVVMSDGGLYFCGICGDIPFIVFNCIYLVVLSSFSLIWLVVCFVDLFKKPAPGFIFWRVFCVSVSFSSALILVISCLLLGFEFYWSCTSSSFNFDDRVSILDLSLLLMWAFIAIYFPLDTALNISETVVFCLCSHWFRRTSIFLPSFHC